MTLECPVCSIGKTEVCTKCKQPVPQFFDTVTFETIYGCMNPVCTEYLVAHKVGDKTGVALCKTCKVLGPNMRQVIANARVRKGTN